MTRNRQLPFGIPHSALGRKVGIARQISAGTLPLSLRAVLLTLCFPEQSSFYIAGLRFTATRFIFLSLIPLLLSKFADKISSGRYRFIFSDVLFGITAIWMILGPANVDGLVPALNHAGPDALEFSGAYFISRMLLSEHGHALSFVNLLCKVIAVVALIGALDSIFGRYVTHDLAQQLTGYVSPEARTEWSDAYRLAVLRASGPIEHPIWFGFICGMGLLIAASIPVQRRLFVIVSCSIGVLLSLSSAPIQCTLLGLGLLTYDRIFYRFQIRWALMLGISGAVVLAVYLITNSPIGFIISHFTFDPSTGYYRVWTWATVTPYIAQSPWFGLGFGTLPDELNHSIDELWLVLGIHYGWPGAILVALSIAFAAAVPTRRPNLDLAENERKLGTTLGIISFLTLFFACTVDILGILWTLTGLFAGVSAHLGELGRLRRSKPKALTSNIPPTEQAFYARSSGA